MFWPCKAETELSERVIHQCNRMLKYNIMNRLVFISALLKLKLRISMQFYIEIFLLNLILGYIGSLSALCED
jgi:hypothetical protein